ncbi:MAG: LPS export ABC transporter periplasmic protein LptC [Gammaproteobacteria bacterium]|nr:LPS export ABC transporter periplasmic protein LptC [Gammaproteobacteria bacterium]
MLTRFIYQFQNILSFGLIFLSVLALALWMQGLVITRPDITSEPLSDDDSDFFMENVVLTGKDSYDNHYQIKSERLVHYPTLGGSSLESLQLTQYRTDGTIQNITSNQGWLDNDKQTLTLSEEVRIRNRNDKQPSSLSITERLVIHLKQQGGQS